MTRRPHPFAGECSRANNISNIAHCWRDDAVLYLYNQMKIGCRRQSEREVAGLNPGNLALLAVE